MANYVEDRVESLEYAVLKLLVSLMDYECPSCGSKELFANWGNQGSLLCMGKGCGNTYDFEQISDTIISINKPITFHPQKVY